MLEPNHVDCSAETCETQFVATQRTMRFQAMERTALAIQATTGKWLDRKANGNVATRFA